MELILEKKGIKIESDDINDAINDIVKHKEYHNIKSDFEKIESKRKEHNEKIVD